MENDEDDGQMLGAQDPIKPTTEHGSTPPGPKPIGNVHSTPEDGDQPGEMPPPLPN